jgi:2-C-methyl-D-erythritol 4-phosphate cytidylyltransferase
LGTVAVTRPSSTRWTTSGIASTGTATVPKDDLVLTQSPQAFRAGVLRAAHADLPRPVENSSLLVARGHRVVAVPGDPVNLHVTTPAELRLMDRLATEGQPV